MNNWMDNNTPGDIIRSGLILSVASLAPNPCTTPRCTYIRYPIQKKRTKTRWFQPDNKPKWIGTSTLSGNSYPACRRLDACASLKYYFLFIPRFRQRAFPYFEASLIPSVCGASSREMWKTCMFAKGKYMKTEWKGERSCCSIHRLFWHDQRTAKVIVMSVYNLKSSLVCYCLHSSCSYQL